MNEPVAGQHFFKSLVCVVMALLAMDDGNDHDDIEGNDDPDDDDGGDDEGGDDDAGDDVLQIADFTANHLSCFSWWLQRCQEDCAQSQKYKKTKKY